MARPATPADITQGNWGMDACLRVDGPDDVRPGHPQPVEQRRRFVELLTRSRRSA